MIGLHTVMNYKTCGAVILETLFSYFLQCRKRKQIIPDIVRGPKVTKMKCEIGFCDLKPRVIVSVKL